MSIAIGFPVQITLEDFKDVFLTSQFFSPHLLQFLLGGFALEVEEMVVLQVTKGRGGRVAPATVGEVVPVFGSTKERFNYCEIE